jgi:hypothetical protein
MSKEIVKGHIHKDKNLKDKEKLFCEEYVRTGNATQTYLMLYPESSIKSANVSSSKWLSKTNIQVQIQILQEEKLKASKISKQSIIDDCLRCREKCEKQGDWKNHSKYTEIINKMLGLNEAEKVEMTGKIVSINLNLDLDNDEE